MPPRGLRLARGAAPLIGLMIGLDAATGAPTGPLRMPDTQLEPVAWTDLRGWADDDHVIAFEAFLNSCQVLAKSRRARRDARPIGAALRAVCKRAIEAAPLSNVASRAFFEDNFRPLRIAKLAATDGFLTGYYEPIVDGSRFPTPAFHVPLYRRPDDLVARGHRKGADDFPNKGARVGRLVDNRKLVPYYTRAEIEDGALDGRHLEICYLKDPIDAFFAQIQGSLRVRLEDGTLLRLNYDSHNGHPYTSIGRVLIDRKLVPKNEMSMDRIRQWMQANPAPAKDVRRQNASYVFFRIVGLGTEDEAIGAQGVPLSPGRSIAVDKALHVYGTPFWIDADLPLANAKSSVPFRRLMVAQDTGSAIIGPARADIYFGAGDDAGQVAGRLRHPGQFVMFVPREIDPVLAGSLMPVPRARPGRTAVAHAKADRKDEPKDAVAVPVPKPAAQRKKKAAVNSQPKTSRPVPARIQAPDPRAAMATPTVVPDPKLKATKTKKKKTAAKPDAVSSARPSHQPLRLMPNLTTKRTVKPQIKQSKTKTTPVPRAVQAKEN